MLNDFKKTKLDILNKLDKSSKGNIDEKIKDLCDTINNKDNLISLSTCSGRICLLEVVEENNKKFSKWLTLTHDKANLNEYIKELENYKGNNRIDFKIEFAIIHIQTTSIENGQKLIRLAKESGFNRCGIISSKRKIVVELICKMPHSIPIYDEKLLITNEYLKYLIDFSNNKLVLSWNYINNLEKAIKENFS